MIFAQATCPILPARDEPSGERKRCFGKGWVHLCRVDDEVLTGNGEHVQVLNPFTWYIKEFSFVELVPWCGGKYLVRQQLV